jgi:hypothetical protein
MACGFASRCGRPTGHRGHHGGWRTGIAATAPDPVYREPRYAEGDLGSELTAREIAAIGETIYHGRYADAAACIGIATQTIKNHASSALVKTGAGSLIHAAYLMGWVTFPAGIAHQEGVR